MVHIIFNMNLSPPKIIVNVECGSVLTEQGTLEPVILKYTNEYMPLRFVPILCQGDLYYIIIV